MHSVTSYNLKKTAVLAVLALLLFLFGLNTVAVEYFYADRFYPLISVVQRAVSNILPFSIGDLLYILLGIYCIFSLVKAFKGIKSNPSKTAYCFLLLQLLNFGLLLYILFKLLWGLNYSRPSISTRLGISNEIYTTKDLILLGDFLVQKVNAVEKKRSTTKRQYTLQELKTQSKIAYDNLAVQQPFFKFSNPSLKPVTFSWLITKIGIEGYYCPISGEANINMRLPYMELPFVACHELSHTLGIAREDEANLIGYMTSINSPDLNFQYSGYYNILRSVLFEIRIKAPEESALLLTKINRKTLADFNEERVFWQKYNGNMSDYMSSVLDTFLKANNQAKGTASYQDIVLWVYNLHKNEL